MEDLSTALFYDTVPDTWVARAYPSMMGLAAWYADLLLRSRVSYVLPEPPLIVDIGTVTPRAVWPHPRCDGPGGPAGLVSAGAGWAGLTQSLRHPDKTGTSAQEGKQKA
jgi:hypothetical protein